MIDAGELDGELRGHGWRAVPLSDEHAGGLARLYEDCGDFFELIYGGPAGPADVQDAFTSLPDGKTYEDKFAFVIIDDDDRAFGQLELIRGYPDADEWWIGILLLAPAQRGRGLGVEINDSCLKWVRRQNARALQLAVAEENVAALRFWSRLGYEELERKGPRRMGSKEHLLIVMRKPV